MLSFQPRKLPKLQASWVIEEQTMHDYELCVHQYMETIYLWLNSVYMYSFPIYRNNLVRLHIKTLISISVEKQADYIAFPEEQGCIRIA